MIRGRALALTMNALLRSASVLALVAAALVAHAQLVITTGAASTVVAPTNFATFSQVSSYGTDLSTYQEGGLSVTTPAVSYQGFDPSVGNPSGGFNGSYYYPNGGSPAAVLIKRVDGLPIVALQLAVGNGYGLTTDYLKFFGVRGGSIYTSTTFDVRAGSFVGVADPLGFDALYIGSYQGDTVAQAATINTRTNIALDTLTVRAQPVPEPATFCALGLGAVAMLRRRKRA